MFLPGFDSLLATVGTSLAAGAGRSVHPVLGWLRSRLRSANQRRLAYQRLHVALIQARLRIDILLAVQHSQNNPVNVVALLTGFGTAVRCLDHVATDLASVFDAWLTVDNVAPPKVRAGARETVLALTALLDHTEPTWPHFIRRQAVKAAAKQAREHYKTRLRELDRLTTADAGARRRERASARRRQGVWAQRSTS